MHEDVFAYTCEIELGSMAFGMWSLYIIMCTEFKDETDFPARVAAVFLWQLGQLRRRMKRNESPSRTASSHSFISFSERRVTLP